MRHRVLFYLSLALTMTLAVSGCSTPTPSPTAVPSIVPTIVTQSATIAPTVASTIAATTGSTAATTAATEIATSASVSSSAPTMVATTAATAIPTAASTVSASTVNSSTFVIADVSSTPTKSIATLQPLADYLAQKLAPAGITNVTIKVAPDFDTIAKWLKSGEVDMLFQTPYPVILLQDAVGAQPILRRWRDGDAEYSSVIFARADSGMKTLTDLKGKMLAVQDEFSTSAYMMPLAYIADAGIKITSKIDPTATVAAEEIGFTNSSGDDNTLQWVISGKVAAGTTDFRHYQSLPDESRKQLVILAQTANIPRGVVVVRPGMDGTLLSTLKTILIDMDKSTDGKSVLDKIQKTTHFDELPGGPEAALASVRKLTTVLKGALGK